MNTGLSMRRTLVAKRKSKSKNKPLEIRFNDEPEAQAQCQCGSAVVGPVSMVKKFIKDHKQEKVSTGFGRN